ncbi:hypothetical protein [Clostridium sp. ZS2-4]|uniref:hypothetical protein n=1 Tax=Clostridium sp. ZS2-4 TaxID=2987703 RepID=UPI00227B521D|nr:hypothetical protein [Clostridium sp. ZS2-4]
MLKKLMLVIISVIIIVVGVFNGYKLKHYNEFKNYLSKTYPNKSFKLHWSKYNFIYGGFYAKVHCNNDGTNFIINAVSLTEEDRIEEHYLIVKNKDKFNKLSETIQSNLQKESEFNCIKKIYIGVSSEEILNTDKEINCKEIADTVNVYFEDNSIQDTQQFAKMAYKTIHALKDNQININYIYFVEEMNKGVYELHLRGEQINKEAEEIFKLIKKLK